MARKKLLTEGEIRQFMKLANLQPIQKARLSEMGYAGARSVTAIGDPVHVLDEFLDLTSSSNLDVPKPQFGNNTGA